MEMMDRFHGCLIGLAVGDAVGTTVEFKKRGTFNPVVDMAGGGPFGLNAGQWTDDTSMALCLAASLVEKKGFDPIDQMDRYWQWYQHGYMSSTGVCFDIGNTVREALINYRQSGESFCGNTSPYSAGNGSLMRLAPVSLYYFPDLHKTLYFATESSRTTHGAPECLEACQLFAELLFNVFSGMDKESLLVRTTFKPAMTKIMEITTGNFRNKGENEIKGSGYVVESMEAALWCFYQSNSFEEAILKSVNLGDDADTTAAICGQIAGAYYGLDGIPDRWLSKLFMRDEIISFVDKLRSNEYKE